MTRYGDNSTVGRKDRTEMGIVGGSVLAGGGVAGAGQIQTMAGRRAYKIGGAAQDKAQQAVKDARRMFDQQEQLTQSYSRAVRNAEDAQRRGRVMGESQLAAYRSRLDESTRFGLNNGPKVDQASRLNYTRAMTAHNTAAKRRYSNPKRKKVIAAYQQANANLPGFQADLAVQQKNTERARKTVHAMYERRDRAAQNKAWGTSQIAAGNRTRKVGAGITLAGLGAAALYHRDWRKGEGAKLRDRNSTWREEQSKPSDGLNAAERAMVGDKKRWNQSMTDDVAFNRDRKDRTMQIRNGIWHPSKEADYRQKWGNR